MKIKKWLPEVIVALTVAGAVYAFVPQTNTMHAMFLGTNAGDNVGNDALGADGTLDWHIEALHLKTGQKPTKVRVTTIAGGVWENPKNVEGNWIVGFNYREDFGRGDFVFNPYGSPEGMKLELTYADGSKLTADVGPAFTPQEELMYELRRSMLPDMTSVANAEANGTVVMPYSRDVTTATVNGLEPDTSYYFTVIVKDKAGNKSVYQQREVRTLPAPPPPPTEPDLFPVVTWKTPVPGGITPRITTKTYSLSGTASDDKGSIVEFKLYLGSQLLKTAACPCGSPTSMSYSWNTNSSKGRTVTLYLSARDSAGQIKTQPITVFVVK